MRRAVITAPRTVHVETVPVPEPGPGAALVRVGYCAICTYEQRLYTGYIAQYPIVGGHEVGGIVEAVGPGVYNVKPGEKVVVAGLYRCGQCDACRRGVSNLCEYRWSRRQPGQVGGPGGFGEYLLRGADDLFPVPQETPLHHAALGEPIACVVRSVKKAATKPHDRVVIAGAGIMGLLHLQILRGRVSRILVSEPDPERAARALEMGADGIVNPVEGSYADQVKEQFGGLKATCTFVAVSVAKAVEDAVSATADGGRVMCYAAIPKGSTVTLDPNVFHHHEIAVTGTVSQTPEDFHDAAALIASGRLNLDPLMTDYYPLGRIQEALEAAVNRKAAYRVVMEPGK
jgi:threonine dehydrogenase-like Zn-dependent dehydrogenase